MQWTVFNLSTFPIFEIYILSPKLKLLTFMGGPGVWQVISRTISLIYTAKGKNSILESFSMNLFLGLLQTSPCPTPKTYRCHHPKDASLKEAFQLTGSNRWCSSPHSDSRPESSEEFLPPTTLHKNLPT